MGPHEVVMWYTYKEARRYIEVELMQRRPSKLYCPVAGKSVRGVAILWLLYWLVQFLIHAQRVIAVSCACLCIYLSDATRSYSPGLKCTWQNFDRGLSFPAKSRTSI